MSKKKILFVCQYFYPETFRGNDIAFHLAENGHDVHVVTGIPNYPKGKFFAGYGLFKRWYEVINGVKVTHLPIIRNGVTELPTLVTSEEGFALSEKLSQLFRWRKFYSDVCRCSGLGSWHGM